MMKIDKAQVARHFAVAVPHYDKAALPQRHFAALLAEMVSALPLPQRGKALEIGCGTGIFSEKLRSLLQAKEVYYQHTYNDLSAEVEPSLRHKVGDKYTFWAGDAETMEWGEGYTLITTAACVQWWHDPLLFPKKAYHSLISGGLLAFSTFLPDNLYQLSNITSAGLRYATLEEVQKSLSEAGFKELSIRTECFVLHFDNLLSLLQHLKHTGTNFTAHTQKGMWTMAQLARLEQAYREAEGVPFGDPLPLTYQALLVTAIK